ncbi:MAG: DUF1800 domain-containing protein [Leadbetterella sp.]
MVTSTKGLQEYKGAWTVKEVSHFLRRTMFGAKQSDIDYFLKMTPSSAVEEMIKASPTPAPPVNDYEASYKDTQGIELGQTWVKSPYGDGTLNGNRMGSLRRWWMSNLVNQSRSISEKLIIFWHNHFVIEFRDAEDSRLNFKYMDTLRTNHLGNFKKFTKDITLDPAMLRYLNGRVNSKTAPDENYGRELQELFTVGKGANSKYTEDDVKAAARVLTGFQDDAANITFRFSGSSRHDENDKQFSAFYGNKMIKGRKGVDGQKELDDLLDMIFSVDEVALFISRRVYTYFLHSDINPDVEKNVIAPLAKIFRDSNYEIMPMLKAFFKSEHFHDSVFHGCTIKSPTDFVVGMIREFGITPPDPVKNTLAEVTGVYNHVNSQLGIMQQALGDPPNVAGWGSYYQEPNFSELWTNSDTFPKRSTLIDLYTNANYKVSNFNFFVDPIELANKTSNPGDPNQLLKDINQKFFSIELSKTEVDQLKKESLLGNQDGDFYWTEVWEAHVKDPNNGTKKSAVLTKLRPVIKYLIGLPEYQLH